VWDAKSKIIGFRALQGAVRTADPHYTSTRWLRPEFDRRIGATAADLLPCWSEYFDAYRDSIPRAGRSGNLNLNRLGARVLRNRVDRIGFGV
jgi:hypothetical protein